LISNPSLDWFANGKISATEADHSIPSFTYCATRRSTDSGAWTVIRTLPSWYSRDSTRTFLCELRIATRLRLALSARSSLFDTQSRSFRAPRTCC
jgi:hypothetical protein